VSAVIRLPDGECVDDIAADLEERLDFLADIFKCSTLRGPLGLVSVARSALGPAWETFFRLLGKTESTGGMLPNAAERLDETFAGELSAKLACLPEDLRMWEPTLQL